MDDITSLIDPVVHICRQAGAEIMKIYNQETTVVTQKSNNTPVTAADYAANAIICQQLQQLSVDYPIVSEENVNADYQTRSHYHRYWLVDPLDGTKEFIKRNGEFTVNIALVQEGMPILGVVYAPATQQLYYGSQGGGAYYMDKDSILMSISAEPLDMQDQGLRIVVSRSHINTKTEAWISQLDQPSVLHRGSSLKMVMIAAGQADIYPKIGPTMEWDTAAADAILRAAGGQITQLSNGQPLEYNKEDLTNPDFIAIGHLQ